MRKQPLSLKRSVFIRLLIITVAAVLLFYAIGLYINSMGVENVREHLQSAMDSSVQYIAGETEREIANLFVFQQELASDNHLLRYVIAHDILSDYRRVEYVSRISDQLLRITRFSSIVETAKVHLPKLGVTISADRPIYDSLVPGAWEHVPTMDTPRVWDVFEWNDQISLMYTKYDRGQPLFIIEVGLSTHKLMQRLSIMRGNDQVATVLLRQDRTVLASDTQSDVLALKDILTVGDSSEYLIAEAEIPSLGLTLRCINTTRAALLPLLRHRAWVWVLTLLAGALLVTYLTYYRVVILRPLNTIFESVRKAEETGHFLIDQQNADFDDIYAQFNRMVARIEGLASQVYEEQYRAQRAELRQLQMQINPHFFYNTLFMVYRMAQKDGNDEIAQLSLNLSNYYRYITQMPEHDVALRHEVAHVQHYLNIQRMRFSPRVTIEMQALPQVLEEEKLPPLILQPIVENAFIHGMKDKTRDGYVGVSFDYDEDSYAITVRDNGDHIDEAAVEELRRRLANGEMEDGSALHNLNRRLILRYGEDYTLRLESRDSGLLVSIRLPRREGNPHAVAAHR